MLPWVNVDLRSSWMRRRKGTAIDIHLGWEAKAVETVEEATRFWVLSSKILIPQFRYCLARACISNINGFIRKFFYKGVWA